MLHGKTSQQISSNSTTKNTYSFLTSSANSPSSSRSLQKTADTVISKIEQLLSQYGPSSTPRSYKIEANGRIYRCTRQHICTINTIQPFTRSCASQYQNSTKQDNNSLKRPPPAQNRAKTFIPGPSAPPKPVYKSLTRPPQPHSSNNNTGITGPSTPKTNIPKKVSLQDHYHH